MKQISHFLIMALAVTLFASCAQTKVDKTYLSNAPVEEPRSIYIRPFSMSNAIYRGDHGWEGDRDLREGQAAVKFARILKQELGKIAPAKVLDDDEVAPEGWVVDGEFDRVHAGNRAGRAVVGVTGLSRSSIALHVRVTDAKTKEVYYAFDVTGGSGMTGPFGNTGAPGVGLAESFDFRNAAQTIYEAIAIDSKREGYRSTRP